MFEEEIIFFKVEGINNNEEALEFLSDQLSSRRVVTESFKKAIIDRENIFPTGLKLNQYGVAIPHADPNYVNMNQIALMTLADPVMFKRMEDPSLEVQVNLIIVLALKDPDSQLMTLKALMNLFQDKEVINSILNFDNTNKSIIKLKELLNSNFVI
ncbi:PTS galactitol transporter subunit IIA [Tetragenococcus halophilus subsp. flandriensis]|nr:PTS galactitol transporter subunit IIA [Tetragenococcus halophilus subsp. flandriensis]